MRRPVIDDSFLPPHPQFKPLNHRCDVWKLRKLLSFLWNSLIYEVEAHTGLKINFEALTMIASRNFPQFIGQSFNYQCLQDSPNSDWGSGIHIREREISTDRGRLHIAHYKGQSQWHASLVIFKSHLLCQLNRWSSQTGIHPIAAIHRAKRWPDEGEIHIYLLTRGDQVHSGRGE